MTTKTQLISIAFSALPAIGAELDGGTFAGITTSKDGTHAAVILLPDHGEQLTWKKALNWSQKLGAELPSRPVASMLFANCKAQLKPNWHWTSEAYDASYAWYCTFGYGFIHGYHESFEGAAVAVRLIPLTA
jgi:hypothetical protein